MAERGVPTRREAIRITAVAGLGLAFSGGVVAGLVRRGRLRRVRVTRTALGTAVTVTVVSSDAELAHSLLEIAFAEIERLENILSRHRAGTAVYRLNQTGTVADPPTALRDVVARALHYAALTDGAFDVTVAPLLALYTDRFARTDAPPSDDDIAATLSLVGWRNLRVTHDAIALDRPGMAVTLDGIAKGYIVDRAVAALVVGGAEHVLVGASGDMAMSGDGTDDSWRIALQHPRDARRDIGVLQLHGEAVASSGDYVQSFTPDLRLHHILDPRTGRSPEEASAVTVVAHTAMDADALSTSVFVLGPDAGIALLERLDGVEGMVVTKTGKVVASAGFASYREA